MQILYHFGCLNVNVENGKNFTKISIFSVNNVQLFSSRILSPHLFVFSLFVFILYV